MLRKGWLLAGLFLLGLGGVVLAQGTSSNPAPGSLWTYFGPTFGAGWGPVPTNTLYIDVKAYGAKGDNSTDNASFIGNAAAAAATAGLPLFFPAGIYATSTPLVMPAGAVWVCNSRYNTWFRAMDATSDVLRISNINTNLSHCGFTTNVMRTAGAYIKVSAGGATLDDIYMDKAFVGLDLETGAGNFVVSNILIYGNLADTTPSIGILLNETADENLTIDYAIVSFMNVGMSIPSLVGAMECALCKFVANKVANLAMVPGAGKNVVSFKMIGGHLDTPGAGGTNLYIGPTGTGQVSRSDFTGTWFGSAPVNNIAIVTDAASAVNGISFANCETVNSGGAGLTLSAGHPGSIIGVSWIGGKVSGNASGFSIGSDVHNTLISGAQIGAVGGFPANSSSGILLSGLAQNTTITGNNLIGNTLVPDGLGNNNRVVNNSGFNPGGGKSLAIGASPFTYTAGHSPETVYGWGGNITTVSQNSVVVVNATTGPWSVELGPNDSIGVAYTTPPTMNAIIH